MISFSSLGIILSVAELFLQNALVAELAYAHDSGSCPGSRVWVQVPSSAFLFSTETHLHGLRDFFVKNFSFSLLHYNIYNFQLVNIPPISINKQEISVKTAHTDTNNYHRQACKMVWFSVGKIKNQYSYMSIIIMFLIISHMAWIWEGIITMYEVGEFVNRGFLHGFWLPIYGIGSILLIIILGRAKHSLFSVFLYSMIICSIIEYMTSLALEHLFHQKWWDYSYLKFNLNGRICLFSMVMFGVAGCLLIYYIAPYLNKLISKIPVNIQKFICIIFSICFFIDMFVSFLIPNAGLGITF